MWENPTCILERTFLFQAGLGYGADCWAPLTNHKSILSRKGLIRIIKPNLQYKSEVRNRICPHMTVGDHYVCLTHLSEACALSSAPRVQFDFTDHTDAGGCQRRQMRSVLGWPLLPLLLWWRSDHSKHFTTVLALGCIWCSRHKGGNINQWTQIIQPLEQVGKKKNNSESCCSETSQKDKLPSSVGGSRCFNVKQSNCERRNNKSR